MGSRGGASSAAARNTALKIVSAENGTGQHRVNGSTRSEPSSSEPNPLNHALTLLSGHPVDPELTSSVFHPDNILRLDHED
jgi:hypothetical protein